MVCSIGICWLPRYILEHNKHTCQYHVWSRHSSPGLKSQQQNEKEPKIGGIGVIGDKLEAGRIKKEEKE